MNKLITRVAIDLLIGGVVFTIYLFLYHSHS